MIERTGTAISKASASVADGVLSRLKAFTADVNSTNWVIFTGTVAGLCTALVFLTGIMLEKHPEAVTFGMWLGFVASWIGFGVKQFRIKRETHSELSPQNKPKEAASAATPGA